MWIERDKIVGISRGNGGEKYIKSLDGYSHLLTMLFAIISNDIFKVSEGTLRRAGRMVAGVLRHTRQWGSAVQCTVHLCHNQWTLSCLNYTPGCQYWNCYIAKERLVSKVRFVGRINKKIMILIWINYPLTPHHHSEADLIQIHSVKHYQVFFCLSIRRKSIKVWTFDKRKSILGSLLELS